ncbi:hypothetical protein THAOC_33472 [Thalassiosira oceanica]|uniref:Peptidase S1 domain-containing protein n=1 Tax=Thalassiosira oceanica TaxID=159749 RepID=K0R542_THAOC|nr:hypothetical protein THAOC_33472 [Thalassiosira oceanica]|eukprot:EJK47790.1 hypothetical protein THAOC_33472 [Thalassiosira oceanica]
MNPLSTTLFLSTLAAVATGKTNIRGGEHHRELQRDRIIGGSEAQEDRYSFAVSLQDRIGHFCGGTLISPDTVLSAAHCGGGGYDIVVGRHDHGDRDGEVMSVKKERKHPNYESDTTNNDYMLIFLDEPVSVDNVKFASVTDNFVGANEAVTVVGWGDIDIDLDEEELPDELQEVEVFTISNNECDDSEGVIDGEKDNYHGQITSSMLCAEHPKRKDACQGDSGGPLVKKSGSGSGEEFELVGVVSWGVGCAHDDFPGVYARVSAEYRWIKEEVCKRSSHPPASFSCEDDSSDNDGVDDPPTLSPSLAPTLLPTTFDESIELDPTLSPTLSPSLAPTLLPTILAETDSLSLSPTLLPTILAEADSLSPTLLPTILAEADSLSPTLTEEDSLSLTLRATSLTEEDIDEGNSSSGSLMDSVRDSASSEVQELAPSTTQSPDKDRSGVKLIGSTSTPSSNAMSLNNGESRINHVCVHMMPQSWQNITLLVTTATRRHVLPLRCERGYSSKIMEVFGVNRYMPPSSIPCKPPCTSISGRVAQYCGSLLPPSPAFGLLPSDVSNHSLMGDFGCGAICAACRPTRGSISCVRKALGRSRLFKTQHTYLEAMQQTSMERIALSPPIFIGREK